MYRFLFAFGFIFITFQSTIYSQGCITINQHPQDYLTLDNDDIVLTVDAISNENLTYQWQFFNNTTNLWEDITDTIDYDGINSNTLTITNIRPSINNSLFRVITSDQNNICSPISSDEALITYIIITVNNIFTPNGDGFNELFKINGILKFKNSKLQIYNRWGNLIYEKIGYQNDWDGVATSGFSINGSKKVPPGTYFYTIDLNFDNKKLSGWLYINR